MKIYKPKFWDENIGIFALILLPLSIIFTIIIFLKKKFTRGQKFKVPVICVGNIYIGGTGKTSLSIQINKILKNKFRTVFVKKRYLDQLDETKMLQSHGKIISDENNPKNPYNQYTIPEWIIADIQNNYINKTNYTKNIK